MTDLQIAELYLGTQTIGIICGLLYGWILGSFKI